MMKYLQKLKRNMHIKYSEQSMLDLDAIIVDSYLIFYTVQKSIIIIRRILNSAVNYRRKKT
jgi:hypothetical protein